MDETVTKKPDIQSFVCLSIGRLSLGQYYDVFIGSNSQFLEKAKRFSSALREVYRPL